MGFVENNVPFKLVLIDLDDVLCDFIGGTCRRWNLGEVSTKRVRRRDGWDMKAALGREVGREMTEELFWRRLQHDPNFWAGLRIHEWARELLSYLQSVSEDYRIVSAPGPCPSSYQGKAAWVLTYLGPLGLDRLLMTRFKTDYATAGVLLIDDREETVDKFVVLGGSAIVFPGPHNQERAAADKPLEFIKESIRLLTTSLLTLESRKWN